MCSDINGISIEPHEIMFENKLRLKFEEDTICLLHMNNS